MTNEKICDKITTYTAEVLQSAYLAVYIVPQDGQESKRKMSKKCKQFRVYRKFCQQHTFHDIF